MPKMAGKNGERKGLPKTATKNGENKTAKDGG
jgi:hypothetical protein